MAAMGDKPATLQTVRSATRHALRLALERGLKSIAFPLLGTGVVGLPRDGAIGVMLEELRSRELGSNLYGYSQADADAIRAQL